jgi:hypothetical protein
MDAFYIITSLTACEKVVRRKKSIEGNMLTIMSIGPGIPHGVNSASSLDEAHELNKHRKVVKPDTLTGTVSVPPAGR